MLDVNGDGVSDLSDLTLIWKYFAKTLTSTNFNKYINTRCTRMKFTDILTFLDSSSGLNQVQTVLPEFFVKDTTLASTPTSSFLSPYITTIGLYDKNDLVAVAKLGTPIKNTADLPLNFIIRFDI